MLSLSSKPKPRLGEFWSYVDKSSDCWIWTGARATFGYGRYKEEAAHRVAFRLTHGPIPEGAYILHSCDNPPCVNPAHLRVGNAADNMADRSERGRAPVGEENYAWRRSTLTVDDVRAIRADSRTTRTLAPLYGVSSQTISDIRRRRSWRWVD